MAKLPSYTKEITEEIGLPIEGDTFLFRVPLENDDEVTYPVADPTGYSEITGVLWKDGVSQGEEFRLTDGSIIAEEGSILFYKVFSENTYPSGKYEMQVQFHAPYLATTLKQSYIFFRNLYITGDVNPT